MPLSYSAYFDENRGYYRARRWGSAGGKRIDGAPRIPDEWWRERGINPPSEPSEKHDKMALRYAAAEAQRLDEELSANRGGGKKRSLRQVFELLRDLNPRLADQKTIAKWEVDFANLSAFIDVDATLPEDVDMALATRFRNWRMAAANRGQRTPRARTILNEMSFLRQLVRFAANNPSETGATAIKLFALPTVEEDDSRKVALSVEEYRELHRAADERDRDIVLAGVTTLLRKTNLLSLDASWVDFERSWLRVDRALLKGGRRRNRRDLDVPVAKWTSETLGRYGIRKGLFWPSPARGIDQPLTWLEHVLETLSTSTGVRPFSLHDLRDTGMSWLYAAGVDDMVIGRLAAHAGGDALARTRGNLRNDVTDSYIHIFEPQLREAVGVFDDLRGAIEI